MKKRRIHGSQTGVHEIELKPKSEQLDPVNDLENPPVAVEQQIRQKMSASELMSVGDEGHGPRSVRVIDVKPPKEAIHTQ